MQRSRQTDTRFRKEEARLPELLPAPTHLIGRRVAPMSRKIATWIAGQETQLVLDLRETRRIDVNGLVLLLETHSLLRARGKQLEVLCSNGPVLQLIESLELHLEFTVLTHLSQLHRVAVEPGPELLRKTA